MTDIEISKNSKKLSIIEIASKLSINKNDLVLYGDYKAKINSKGTNNGNLILVTAISPTPMGEGKTTVSIGLSDALNKIGKKSIVTLRQPSMGPVFGMKGGATGGGYSQVIPMEDINLHFTGDFHAITAANNLISAAIDNHIYFGNSLQIKKVLFKRCLDVNDRELRNVSLNNRNEGFNITSASEIMALFCLANSLDDLRERLGNVIVGINNNSEYVYVKDLKIVGSLLALLKDAFSPNLVQTLENNPAIIHGGPFANIAHGCNSIIATNTALSYADYVVTEAGFGADLGAEKFFDIKCRVGNFKPQSVVLVATIKALKYHGGVCVDAIYEKNNEAIIKGFENLKKHYSNLKKYNSNIVVCLNRFSTDSLEEVKCFEDYCEEQGYVYSVSTAFTDGSDGALDLANKIVSFNDEGINYLYDLNTSIKDKINIICNKIYGANNVNYTDIALSKIDEINNNNLSFLPICVAKTQYSLSDDKSKVGVPTDFSVTVRDLDIYNGAGFITVLLGNIMTMPGLSKNPNYELIDVIDGEIVNLN